MKKLAVIDILSETEAFSKPFTFKSPDEASNNPDDSISLFQELHYIYKSSSVTDYDHLKSVMSDIRQEFGRLDIVINAAGIANEIDHQKMIDINFVSRTHS